MKKLSLLLSLSTAAWIIRKWRAASGKAQKQVQEPPRPLNAQTPVVLNFQTAFELLPSFANVHLRGLLEDRLCTICLERKTENKALEAVNLLDEIDTFHQAYAETNDYHLLAIFKAEIKAYLIKHGCVLLNSDTWNPDIQRAVKITRTETAAEEPTITAKYATGLSVNGQLIRKQEVELLKAL